jgi:hypothetical protein
MDAGMAYQEIVVCSVLSSKHAHYQPRAQIDSSREEPTLNKARLGKGSKVPAMKEEISPSSRRTESWFLGTPKAFQQKTL